MAEMDWISGPAVLALLDQAYDKAAARADFENAFALGQVKARYASRSVTRKDGTRQVLPGEAISPKLWTRIRSTYQADAVWSAGTLQLPASAKEPPTTLLTVKYGDLDVRMVLSRHGLPVPVMPKVRTARTAGGHNMGAHGAVITGVVIDLLKRPRRDVALISEKQMAAILLESFAKFDPKRTPIGLENRIRMARQILARVLIELDGIEAAQGDQVVEVVLP